MIPWILFISMTFNGQVTGTYVKTEEFNNKANCLIAAKLLNEQGSRGLKTFCVPK